MVPHHDDLEESSWVTLAELKRDYIETSLKNLRTEMTESAISKFDDGLLEFNDLSKDIVAKFHAFNQVLTRTTLHATSDYANLGSDQNFHISLGLATARIILVDLHNILHLAASRNNESDGQSGCMLSLLAAAWLWYTACREDD
ncbi:hypothetical protein KEM54_002000 [Ascosphaera aggregata]|nr:hypothetical protein KEM54_002000 [Ascosphaera aggregata]